MFYTLIIVTKTDDVSSLFVFVSTMKTSVSSLFIFVSGSKTENMKQSQSLLGQSPSSKMWQFSDNFKRIPNRSKWADSCPVDFLREMEGIRIPMILFHMHMDTTALIHHRLDSVRICRQKRNCGSSKVDSGKSPPNSLFVFIWIFSIWVGRPVNSEEGILLI